MYNRKSINSLFNRLISVFVVFALFIAIFPARIIHAEEPEEDLFVSETAEEMAEDYAVWPYDRREKTTWEFGEKDYIRMTLH